MGKPQHKGPGRFADLDAWEPSSKYATEEQVGIKAWTGPAPAGLGTTSPPAPLEQIFGDLMKRIWVSAKASDALPQTSYMAQTRQPQPGMPAAAPFRPMVAPMVLNPNAPPAPGAAPRQLPAYPTLPAQQLPAGPRTLPAPPMPRAAPAPPVPAAIPNAHLTGVATDWGLHATLLRFTGHAFRGDHRDPAAIKATGGFMPSSTRDDDGFIKGPVYDQFCNYMQRRFQKNLKATVTPQQFLDIVRQVTKTPANTEAFRFYATWRALAKAEELHMGRMVAQETLKAYISTTRAMPVAKGFAKRAPDKDTGAKALGWVYCVEVDAGFVVPDKKATYWTETFGEAEIAVAGSVPWQSVVAARAVDFTGKFTGDIHVSKGFDTRNPQAFETIFKLMSGKRQV